MDKNYKPSERQKKCMYAFPYMGKEMNKTYCRKLMQERKDSGEDDIAMSSVKTARTMKAGTLSIRFRSTASNVIK